MIIKKNQTRAQTGQESPFVNLNHQLDLC